MKNTNIMNKMISHIYDNHSNFPDCLEWTSISIPYHQIIKLEDSINKGNDSKYLPEIINSWMVLFTSNLSSFYWMYVYNESKKNSDLKNASKIEKEAEATALRAVNQLNNLSIE